MFLRDKPVLYVNQGLDLRPYDADDLGENAAENLWQFRTLKACGIELTSDLFPAIGEVIKNAADSPALQAARHKAREEAWQHQGEGGKRIVDFMVSKT
jgi:hypothetical protein